MFCSNHLKNVFVYICLYLLSIDCHYHNYTGLNIGLYINLSLSRCHTHIKHTVKKGDRWVLVSVCVRMCKEIKVCMHIHKTFPIEGHLQTWLRTYKIIKALNLFWRLRERNWQRNYFKFWWADGISCMFWILRTFNQKNNPLLQLSRNLWETTRFHDDDRHNP